MAPIQPAADGNTAQDTPLDRACQIIGSHFCILSTMLGLVWDESCDVQLREALGALVSS